MQCRRARSDVPTSRRKGTIELFEVTPEEQRVERRRGGFVRPSRNPYKRGQPLEPGHFGVVSPVGNGGEHRIESSRGCCSNETRNPAPQRASHFACPIFCIT